MAIKEKIRGIPKALIIDDSEDVHKILSATLTPARIVVASAYSPEEALKKMQIVLPDVIILDLHLGDEELGGLEVCSKLKMESRFEDIPIIFVTADTDVENRIEAFRSGAADYIGKPFQTEEVLIRTLTQIELSQRRREDNEKNRIQRDLLHLLSHELINPISSGQQLFEMIEADIPQIKTFGPIIEETFQQALTLIDLTRKMMAIDEARKTLDLDFFEIKDILMAVVDHADVLLKNKKIEIVLNIKDDCEILCEWGGMIDGVLKNIIENAIHFSNEGSKIEVTTNFEEDNDLVYIHVIDSGIGIPSKMIPGLFEVSVATKRKGTKGELGNGFGLPLANNLIKSYGGKLDLVSHTIKEGASASGTKVTAILRGRKISTEKAS